LPMPRAGMTRSFSCFSGLRLDFARMKKSTSHDLARCFAHSGSVTYQMRLTQTVENSQTIMAAARASSVRRKDWHLACMCLLLRAVVQLVSSTEVLTLVGMRNRSTTNLPPLTAFLGFVRYKSTAHVLFPHWTHCGNTASRAELAIGPPVSGAGQWRLDGAHRRRG
jgi:hypothetical protein